jgi:hypothetical protein
LYGENEQLSPRVTSIVVMHLATEQTASFSTHAVAEELGIDRADLFQHLDQIERVLLTSFFEFVRDRRDRYWVHWNMRNITYGFEHIEHRYRVLTQIDPPSIPIERRLNLNDFLSKRYGSDYCSHPKMQCLMEKNGGIHRHFLTGKQEVEAFRAEFIKMHNSTLCKVGFFKNVIHKLITGRLKTASRGYGQMLDNLFESRLAKTIALIGSLVAIVAIPLAFI